VENSPPRAIDRPRQLTDSLVSRLYRRSEVSGEITLPAVPAMLDEYVKMCVTLFTGVGKPFSAEQLAHVRAVLEDQLAQAFAASPRSEIVISYNAPVGQSLSYNIRPQWWTLEAAYENWVSTREPPLFGTEPDARVWALAAEASDPKSVRVLDIGGGTGRNALALARRGHPVDVVELTPKFADMLRTDAARELLNVRVIQRDVFSSLEDLRFDYQLILLSEVVSDFRTTQQLRGIFELAALCLAPGGRLVFNAFVARPGYIPDDAAIQLGQQVYTGMFTQRQMAAAASELPLELIADDSAYEYEKANLPDGAWPPTSWYANWASGLDLFEVERESSPVELRWLVYRKDV
jgi:SAM-dependent methyltransferase